MVAPSHRGKRLGEKLISESLLEILKLNTKQIYLFVNPKYSGAVVRYLKQVFIIADWYPNKFGDGENRLKNDSKSKLFSFISPTLWVLPNPTRC